VGPWQCGRMQSAGSDPWAIDEDRWGWRLPVVLVLVLATMLATSTAITLGWSRATLIDTEGYVDALIQPLTGDPQVKDAVATELAAEMTANMGTDISGRLEQLVPPGAVLVRQAMAGYAQQIEQAWRQQLRPAIRTQLDLPSFNALWVEANREAHRQLIEALKDGNTGTTVTLDLHEIAQASVRETGVQLDQQLNLPANVGTQVYAAIAEALPPEAGRIAVDVSRISEQARTVIALVDPMYVISLGAAAFFALVTVGVAPRRRRGTAVILLGLGALVLAGGLWYSASSQSGNAGSRASSLAVKPLSPEMQLVVGREAALAVESFRTWVVAVAAGGVALVLIGGIWRLISGRRRPEPEPAPATDWSYPPSSWSTRTY
jgi:hypothetical protein